MAEQEQTKFAQQPDLAKMVAAAGLSSNLATSAEFYFPPEMVGGVTPRVKGQEREVAWHAAAEACDTERLSLSYQVYNDKVWFLATRNADLAQKPHSWCPFVALLPGMADAQISPVCYTYFSDETAMMMTVTNDMLQIHRGTSSVIRAKSERVSRELGGAAIVELTPEMIFQLTPQSWQSLSLLEDKLRRLLSTTVVALGGLTGIAALIVWLLSGAALLAAQGDLESARERSATKSEEAYTQMIAMRTSPIKEQLARFAEMNDKLVNVNGWLQVYTFEPGKKPVWRAIVPPTMTGDQINELGAKTLETTPQGVLVGTEAISKDKS